MKMKEYRKIPRGLRNCNPLNIRKSNGTKWVGQIGDDGTFCVFEDVVHGLRAAFRLLRTYQVKYKCNTVAQMISRWAPANENHTEAYIRLVCERMKCEPKFIPHFGSREEKDDCCRMVDAMAVVELGGDFLASDVLREAYDLAFGNNGKEGRVC